MGKNILPGPTKLCSDIKWMRAGIVVPEVIALVLILSLADDQWLLAGLRSQIFPVKKMLTSEGCRSIGKPSCLLVDFSQRSSAIEPHWGESLI